jgi:hypothetical protein
MAIPNNGQRGQRWRERPTNRRFAINGSFVSAGARVDMTSGYYADGRIAEVFLNADRANSLLDFLMSDAAIAVSLALQYGAPLDELRHAMKRDARGAAVSPIGQALDLIPSMEDAS